MGEYNEHYAKRANDYSNGRRPTNPTEARCKDFLALSRLVVTSKKGWPDFWWVEGGVLHTVEVKRTGGQKFKRHQVEVNALLKKHGVRTFRYDPDKGLVPL